jgi:membrane protein DedA with SNARE-associated domain
LETILFSLLAKWSYLGLFIVLMAAGLGVPLPEDIPLLAAGWLVHRGQADLFLMMLTGLLGVMVGDSLLFTMGKRYGLHIVEHRWLRAIAKPWMLEKAREKYANHGAKILFAARFMPGLRSVIFLTAGVCRVPYWKFFIIDGAAALISVPLWVWVGWKFSARMEAILGTTRMATIVIVSLLLCSLVVWAAWEYFRYLRKKNRPMPEYDPLAEIVRSAPLVSPDRVEPTLSPKSMDRTAATLK